MFVVDRESGLRVLVKRWLAVPVLVVLGCVIFWSSRQQARNRLAVSAPINVGRLVMLDINDVGYSAYVRAKADELSYDGFYPR